MRIATTRSQIGVTLTEVIVAMAILGLAVGLVKVGIDVLNGFYRNQALSQVHQAGQIALYSMARDVKNARAIISVTPDELILSSFDTHNGYDTDTAPDLFSAVEMATTTYRFRTLNGQAFVERLFDYPNGSGGVSRDRDVMLTNMVRQPSSTEPLFAPIFGWTTAPFQLSDPSSVRLTLRMAPGFLRSAPRVFQMDVSKRGWGA